jgi:ATP-dependent DNA ligase
MLPRSGPLPVDQGWSYEVKWDGFRAIVSTEDGFRVRSRRGWNMTPALPELRRLPDGLLLDGELIAFNRKLANSEPCVDTNRLVSPAGKAETGCAER